MAVPFDITKMVTGYADRVILSLWSTGKLIRYSLDGGLLHWVPPSERWHRKSLIYLTTPMQIVNIDSSVYFKKPGLKVGRLVQVLLNVL